MDEQEVLLQYFQRELSYLRHAGAAFARRYPKVAQRLEMGGQETPDPHVERLLESFAFLTGRIQYNIDREFPEIPAALLDILHPHLMAPVPSMTIARFDVDPLQGKMIGGYTVARHSQLLAPTHLGQSLRFRTAYPVTLWPLEIGEAALEPPDRHPFLDHDPRAAAVLRLRLDALGAETDLAELGLSSLRFHLAADPGRATALYELLFAHCLDVVLVGDGAEAAPLSLGADSLRPVGFGLDEAVLPAGGNEHQGTRLLREYFAFPEKFLFFDIQGLDRLRAAGGFHRRFDLVIVLDERPSGPLAMRQNASLGIDRDSFALGCVPAVNLFPRVTEPLRIDETAAEYRLVPDARNEALCEIHSILRVTASSSRSDLRRSYQPFYSVGHGLDEATEAGRAFWLARRTASERPGLEGSDLWLSFVDLDFTPLAPADRTLFAHTLCTNRAAAEQMPPGALLSIEEDVPARRILALTKPTRQLPAPLGGQALWRLVAQLALNHLSLSDDPEALTALKEILTLHGDSGRADLRQQVAGLREMRCRKVARRLGEDAWRGFVKGTEVTLTIDERLFAGSSAFLFAAVLQHFLALHAHLNSFTQLAVRREGREGIWKTWPPMAGELAVL